MNEQPPLFVPDEIEATDMPQSVQEAVGWLTLHLSQAAKDGLASMPEDELIDHHFGLGAWIRRIFHLNGRHGNPQLLADCQNIHDAGDGDAAKPDGMLNIHPDDASMAIIRALWARLRH
jgi:hypothetical protein